MITRSHTMVQQALENDYLIKRKDLECRVEKLPKKLLDENVNMARVKKYLTISAWTQLIQMKEKLQKQDWDCKICHQTLHGNSLGCDVCLEWFHLACLGKQNFPKTKNWICRSCYKAEYKDKDLFIPGVPAKSFVFCYAKMLEIIFFNLKLKRPLQYI